MSPIKINFDFPSIHERKFAIVVLVQYENSCSWLARSNFTKSKSHNLRYVEHDNRKPQNSPLKLPFGNLFTDFFLLCSALSCLFRLADMKTVASSQIPHTQFIKCINHFMWFLAVCLRFAIAKCFLSPFRWTERICERRFFGRGLDGKGRGKSQSTIKCPSHSRDGPAENEKGLSFGRMFWVYIGWRRCPTIGEACQLLSSLFRWSWTLISSKGLKETKVLLLTLELL